MMSDIHDVEQARLRLGSWIVGGAIAAMVVCVAMVVLALNNTDKQVITMSDRVALLGAITTFLSAVVGVFFGVNASSAAGAQANQAAGKVAEAAQEATSAAREVSASAARSLDVSQAIAGQAQAASQALSQATSLQATAQQNTARAAFQTPEAAARGLAGTAFFAAAPAGPEADGIAEDLAGDPDEAPTRLVVPASQELALETFTRGLVHVPVPASATTLFRDRVIAVAAAEAADGVSRSHDRARVTEYLHLLGLPFADGDGTPVRYCAAGLTWAVAKAYCDLNGVAYTDANRLAIFRSVLGDIGQHYFKPSARCQSILDDARERGSFAVRSQAPLPGYLVFYNWSGGSRAEHIGIVERADGGSLHAIEFNTTATDGPNQGNGGAVSRKVRPVKFVIGYARTYS